MPTTARDDGVRPLAELDPEDADRFGQKAAALARMVRLGLPVPPGYVVAGDHPAAALDGLAALEAATGQRFGDPKNPLLVAVRLSPRGRMESRVEPVLNLGMSQAVREGLAARDPVFAFDAYLRFLASYAGLVLNVDVPPPPRGAAGGDGVEAARAHVRERAGADPPDDPRAQLVEAVAACWRAARRRQGIARRVMGGVEDTCDRPQAVIVQAMAFGNRGPRSGVGVAFTRGYSTGARKLMGAFRAGGQGDDATSGTGPTATLAAFQQARPDLFAALADAGARLEAECRDMQEMAFVVEEGRLTLVGTRPARRTPAAAVKVAVDMVAEGLIDRAEAVRRVDVEQLNSLFLPFFMPDQKKEALLGGRLLARGQPGSPGAASGEIALSAERALELGGRQTAAVLVVTQAIPDDLDGFEAAVGVLATEELHASQTSLLTRLWGRPAVVGCDGVRVDRERGEIHFGARRLKEGDPIAIDGGTGEVFRGPIPVVQINQIPPEAGVLLGWADELRRLRVYAKCHTAWHAERARAMGAEGIGLCRVESIIFHHPGRLPALQRVIMAAPRAERMKQAVEHLELAHAEAPAPQKAPLAGRLEAARAELQVPWAEYQEALAALEPMLREDVESVLAAMPGRPAVIRLLDAPLHQFLPRYEDLLAEVAAWRAGASGAGMDEERLRVYEVLRDMKEHNPMLGLRWCRLGILYPDILYVQVRAIFAAARSVAERAGQVRIQVMAPGVSLVNEFRVIRKVVEAIARETLDGCAGVEFQIGSILELPRACLVAGELARHAEFFSFGTNDLTQATFGFSRDDAPFTFLPVFIEQHLIPDDPFRAIDGTGVAELMRMAVRSGRETRPGMEIGICGGEEGFEPSTVALCHGMGLDYISTYPHCVPAGRLAAAQAALRGEADG